MIQIINVSDYLWAIGTAHKGHWRLPVEISLTPVSKPKTNTIRLDSDIFRRFGDGTKEEIATAIRLGIIVVNAYNDLHTSEDITPLPKDYDIIAAGNLNLMLQNATNFNTSYNIHDKDAALHTGPVGTHQITGLGVPPTDWPTLVAFLTQAKTKFNAHTADAGIHTAADPVNIATYATPVVTQADAAAALKQLWGFFKQHKRWAIIDAVASPLTPATVFTY